MEDNKNYERGEHLENITDASMKDDDYFNASRNIDRKYITIEGARENNLKNINVKIPRDKFVVVTGLSGSGKSSLAFDTIYAEGQRRYMESLSSYARQFLGQAEKPDVDKIEGLSPAISIDQKSTNRNPRSTVGTVTEIYDYFRLLYARVGIPHCPNCGKVISRQTVDQMVDEIMKLPERTKFMVLAPVVRGRKGEHVKLLEKAKKSGFVRVVVDGSMYELSEAIKLDKNKKHSIVSGLQALVPTAKIGHIGLYRDEETHEPHEYYCKLPDPIDERLIVVTDPMLATGGSAVAAVDFIKQHGGKHIKFMSIIAAPQGIERLLKAHPDIQLYVGHVDRELNENAYICPGLGDAGDRIFGTK